MTNFLNVLKKELQELFRDKKSLMMMLIIPFMIPLLVIGLSALYESETNTDNTKYNRIGFAYQLTNVEKEIAKEVGIEVINGTLPELEKMYEEEQIDLYITKLDNKYTINGKNDEAMLYARVLVESYFTSYKAYLQSEYLEHIEVSPDEVNNIIQVEENISTEENFFASYIINYAFLFIIMAITVSATYPATDATTGEKERGTLETLLTFPIRSQDIIIGKFVSVSLSSIITGLISFILVYVSLILAGNMFSIYEGVDMALSLNAILFSLLVIIFYSFLISGLCIAIASKSKSFKEAQSALTPITFISFFPGFIAFMLNLNSSNLLSLVPFINFSLIFKDIASSSINPVHILLMILSTVIFIGLVLTIIIKQYRSEKILFSK